MALRAGARLGILVRPRHDDGLALRALADPAANVVDHDWRRCLLGTAALALIAGCVERADHGEGLSLEQAVRAMACASAAQVTERTAAWVAGCDQGREDVLSLARALAAQEEGTRPAATVRSA
jgi:hypothetical protein